MDTPKLRIKDFVAPGDCSHVGRTAFRDGRRVPFHRHDFAEVFWVEAGAGTHMRGGLRERLTAGVVCFIRAADSHGFDARASDGLCIMNVAFPGHVEREMAVRYGSELSPWPWGDAGGATVAPGVEVTQRLTRWAQELARHPGSRVRLDRFLIDLLTLARPGLETQRKAWPAWLLEARAGFASPKRFAGGVEAFAALAGRSPEHVNRTVRMVAGMTTTELVNEMRLEWAQRQLRLTGESVTAVALDAGFENISYFIRIFKDRFGMTPRAYRERNRGLLPMA